MSKRYLFTVCFLIFACFILGGFIFLGNNHPQFINPLASPEETSNPTPLQKYSFIALRNYTPLASRINLTEVIQTEPTYNAYLFTFTTENQLMTGQINVPTLATPSAGFSPILMIRGFVDPSIYKTGVGTKNAAAVFALNGFVTISPDFFGYGGSAAPLADVIGERLQKPLNLLDLIASLSSLSFVNSDNLSIWAHSNGGQIALSLLEISQKAYPTSLWAPVSKPFPYSILYYTDVSEDQGKALRKTVADFEQKYDVFDFSIDRYFDALACPLQIHQGTADDAVPFVWSQDLAKKLQALNKDVTLYTYPGADHNLSQSWDTVVARDLDFYKTHLP